MDPRICQQQLKALFADIIIGLNDGSSKRWIMLTSFENDTGLLSMALWYRMSLRDSFG